MPLVWLPTETDADPTTTIAAPGVSIGDGEVIVTDTASMPPVGYIGWAVIDDEVMTVTGAADNPYPIDRAQAGTVEADHAAGAAFNWTVVPATVIALVKEQVTAADVSGLADALATKLDTAVLDTDGTLAASSDAKVATQKATKTYADLMVPKAGGAMTGDLTVPNIYGDASQGYFTLFDSSGAASMLYMDPSFIWLGDSGFAGPAFYVDLSAGVSAVTGNAIASGAWLAAPKFLSVPVILTKTLLLTTADCGVVLISSAPPTGGIIKLPSLSSGDNADFLIANYTSYDVTVQRQGTNGITLLTTGAVTSFTLAAQTAIRLSYYAGAGIYYQLAPEA